MATVMTPTHNVNGIVKSNDTRSFTSKAGKNLVKTVLILDSGVAIELDGFGDKRSKFSPGTAVDYSVAASYGRFEVVGPPKPGLPELGAVPTPTAVTATTGSNKPTSSAAGRGAFPIKGDDYQVSIVRQNSLTNAVNTVMPMIGDCVRMFGDSDVIKDDPKALAEMVDTVSDRIIRLAYKYAAFSTGTLDTQVVQAVADRALGATQAM